LKLKLNIPLQVRSLYELNIHQLSKHSNTTCSSLMRIWNSFSRTIRVLVYVGQRYNFKIDLVSLDIYLNNFDEIIQILKLLTQQCMT